MVNHKPQKINRTLLIFKSPIAELTKSAMTLSAIAVTESHQNFGLAWETLYVNASSHSESQKSNLAILFVHQLCGKGIEELHEG